MIQKGDGVLQVPNERKGETKEGILNTNIAPSTLILKYYRERMLESCPNFENSILLAFVAL